ncbi:hypothetical protein M0804_011014 [Polistes exclamans]|nr:hypothetical protein M0804_011014 [Polistes exclamans]
METMVHQQLNYHRAQDGRTGKGPPPTPRTKMHTVVVSLMCKGVRGKWELGVKGESWGSQGNEGTSVYCKPAYNVTLLWSSSSTTNYPL